MANETKTIYVRISLFGATAAKWSENNPVLLMDEVGHERDTGKVKIGDGVTPWQELPYFGSDIDAAIKAAQEQLSALKTALTESEAKAAETYEPKFDKNTAFNKDFGNSAGTVTEGNDARLSDARTPKGTAGGDLSGNYPNPTIGNGKVTTNKIADKAVTDDKITAVNVMKLQLNDGDTLILDGGTIE